ncbi:MAG: hypothetical protein R2685_10810 [Candidatus Nitrosocosmicus sp.]|nr:hypothetical protein [Candidatus Nitrosocosmicus sp.]
MVTRLYLYNDTNTLDNLPTAEQSTKTANINLEADQSTNRYMSTGKSNGSQTLITKEVPNSTTMFYLGRWVSDVLQVSTINANTWTLNFAAFTEFKSAQFPVNGDNQPIWINCYVWRPGTGKVGTILDGNSDNTFSNTNSTNFDVTFVCHGTFTGASVSNINTSTDVLVFELWVDLSHQPSQGWDLGIAFGGKTVNTTPKAEVTNHAAFLETPQNSIVPIGGPQLTYFYFHNTLSSVSGTLPSSEQAVSISSISASADAQTVNRTMNTTIGASQTSKQVTLTSSTSLLNYYFTRFVSEPLAAQTITAQTWTYNFATAESALAANAPVSGTNKAIMVTCYVWRPSTGTKVGDIANGTGISSTTYSEPASANSESSQHGTFSGSSVTVQEGDVLCLEMIFDVQMGSTGNGRTFTIYYDGATETESTRTVVSDHASFLSVPINISFQNLGEVIDMTIDSFKVLTNKFIDKV